MPHLKRTQVKVFREELFCECGGTMTPSGMPLTTKPPQYPHVCEKCGKSEIVSGETYPRIVFEKVKRKND